MTLTISTFHRDESGKFFYGPDPETPVSNLGGREVWRHVVWGSSAAKKRGARFLPVLAESDLYVEAEDLQAFAAECRMLLGDLENFAMEVGYTDLSIGDRLRNFLAAAERTDPVNGGIIIC